MTMFYRFTFDYTSGGDKSGSFKEEGLKERWQDSQENLFRWPDGSFLCPCRLCFGCCCFHGNLGLDSIRVAWWIVRYRGLLFKYMFIVHARSSAWAIYLHHLLQSDLKIWKSAHQHSPAVAFKLSTETLNQLTQPAPLSVRNAIVVTGFS